MSKKVLILSSSPRRNGNSDLLCNEFMRGAAEAGHQVEKIFLKDKHINYCTGCSVCSMYGKPCPQKDDAAEVVEKMIAADVIVMATPVYFYTMSAQMKTLIDRCCARYLEIKDKEFYFIIAAAEESIFSHALSLTSSNSASYNLRSCFNNLLYSLSVRVVLYKHLLYLQYNFNTSVGVSG